VSILTRVLIFERFGPVLGLEQLSAALGLEVNTVRAWHSQGKLGITPLSVPGGEAAVSL